MTVQTMTSRAATTQSAAAERSAADKAAEARRAALQATGGSAKDDTAGKPIISADFNMFLKLLTAQMQNQNPLNPMDTSQFTQQLVQFAQTEQTIQQSGTLKNILGKLNAAELSQATGYIGRTARFDTPVAGLAAGTAASWSFQYNQVPTSLVARIKDSKGQVMKTMALSPSAKGTISWDGRLGSGGSAPAGNYTLEIEAKDGNDATLSGAVTATGTISSAMMLDGKAVVTVNGANYPLDALLSIDSAERPSS